MFGIGCWEHRGICLWSLWTTVAPVAILLPEGSVTQDQPWTDNISRNKQLVSFKVRATVSRVMQSHVFLLRPGQHVDHPFVQQMHAIYTTYLPLGKRKCTLYTVGFGPLCGFLRVRGVWEEMPSG